MASFAFGGLLASLTMVLTGGPRHPERATLIYTAIWYALLIAFGHLRHLGGRRHGSGCIGGRANGTLRGRFAGPRPVLPTLLEAACGSALRRDSARKLPKPAIAIGVAAMSQAPARQASTQPSSSQRRACARA